MEDRLAVSQAPLEGEYLMPLSPGISHTGFSRISRLEISPSEVLLVAHQVSVEKWGGFGSEEYLVVVG